MSAPPGRERRQFRALVRLFAYRFFDTDIVSVRGDLSSLLSQLAALLAALSLVLVLITAPKYAGLYQHLTAVQLYAAAWADQEFLISTSMALVGVFTLLLWDALFPDRRDCMILGAMPVRIPAVFAAKLFALVSRRRHISECLAGKDRARAYQTLGNLCDHSSNHPGCRNSKDPGER